jgi:Phosphatidylinositol-4-phosphate 5-Kinase
MAPLMMFLASSFNIELVYVILKGITQFSYLTCNDGKNDFMRKKADKLNLRTETDGSKTLTMNEIKIKDIDKWSDVKTKDV